MLNKEAKIRKGTYNLLYLGIEIGISSVVLLKIKLCKSKKTVSQKMKYRLDEK